MPRVEAEEISETFNLKKAKERPTPTQEGHFGSDLKLEYAPQQVEKKTNKPKTPQRKQILVLSRGLAVGKENRVKVKHFSF